MKKYDIFLNELENKTPEAFEKVCRDFATEFSLSVSGAKILLKQLPALLEIDVSEDRAENYFQFFAQRGGTILLKDRDNLDEEDEVSSLPPDEFPMEEDELASSDFDILMGTSNGRENKLSQQEDEPGQTLKDDFFSNEPAPDSIDSILDMEDEFSLSFESDDDDFFSSSDDERDDKNDDGGSANKTVLKPEIDRGLDDLGAETVLKSEIDKNSDDFGAETVLKSSTDRGESGNKTVLNTQGDQKKEFFGTKSGLELESEEEDVEDIEEAGDEESRMLKTFTEENFDDASKTCLTCRKSFSGPECPVCFPKADKRKDKIDSNVVSRIFSKSSSSRKETGNEFPVFLTEGLFLTFIIAVVSSTLFFILPLKNILYHLAAPLIPLIGMLLLFITGKISLYFKKKKENKEAGALVKIISTSAMVLTYPGQWLVLANRTLYDKNKSVFSGKKHVLINITFSIAAIVCLSTSLFLSKSLILNQKSMTAAVKSRWGKKIQQGNDKTPETPQQLTNKGKEGENTGPRTAMPDSDRTTKYLHSSQKGNNKQSYSYSKPNLKGQSIVGKRVKVTLTNRNEFIGTIINEGSQFYTLNARKYGGAFSFSIFKSDITHIALAPVREVEKEGFITSK